MNSIDLKSKKSRILEHGEEKNAKNKITNSRTQLHETKRPEDAAPKGVHFPHKSLQEFLVALSQVFWKSKRKCENERQRGREGVALAI
jgi:hypothetical protein